MFQLSIENNNVIHEIIRIALYHQPCFAVRRASCQTLLNVVKLSIYVIGKN